MVDIVELRLLFVSFCIGGWVVLLGVGISRWRRKLAGGVVLVIFALALLVGTMAVILMDGLVRAKCQVRLSACRNSLLLLGRAMQEYAKTHSGMYPDRLDMLPNASFPASRSFSNMVTCSESVSRSAFSYQAPRMSASSSPMLWDPEPHNMAGMAFWRKSPQYRNVLFAGGRVETLTEAEFQKRMSATDVR